MVILQKIKNNRYSNFATSTGGIAHRRLVQHFYKRNSVAPKVRRMVALRASGATLKAHCEFTQAVSLFGYENFACRSGTGKFANWVKFMQISRILKSDCTLIIKLAYMQKFSSITRVVLNSQTKALAKMCENFHTNRPQCFRPCN